MTEQKMLKIYDASAGSGKTFNLASNYIATAMKSGFESILAITFTNAATKEMKDRIIDVLQNIAENRNDKETSGYKENIIRLYSDISEDDWQNMNDEDKQTIIRHNGPVIEQRSSEILKRILHRYSFFNISTIDSFFQLVLKNLTKELGVTGNYMLALDSRKYDEQAVKILVQSAGYDETTEYSVLNWLTNYFIEIQEEGKSWNIERALNDFVTEAFKSDEVSKVLQGERSELLSIENLENLRKRLTKDIKQFKNTLKEKRDTFLNRCEQLNLQEKDFKDGRKNGVYGYIKNICEKIITGEELEERKCLDEVYPECCDVIKFLKENCNEYFLKKIYIDNIYQLGVLSNIAKIKSELLKKDNTFVLSDTASLLNKLNDGDVPFVFEKISQRIEHILIDEFQDTNQSSFNNLSKLMDECLQTGGSASIFGDIKQSIYRFGGGDMRIMQELTRNNPESVVPLKKNFRSLGNIVRFNNDLFRFVYESIGIEFIPQEVRREDNTGIVRLNFLKKDDDVFECIKKEIDYYHIEKGYDLSDIALLFRNNDKLIETANKLKNCKEFDYNPISDIAFKFSSSPAVTKIIEALKYIDNSQRKISKEIISSPLKDNKGNEKQSMKESAILQAIDNLAITYKREKSLLEVVMKIADILRIEDDAVFLPAFYDTIKDYTKTRGGNLQEFLIYWEETLQNKSVDMSGVKAGVKLTSIHKSKGLAYKVAIVPYCNNKYYKNDKIWIKTEDGETSLPVFSTTPSRLEHTRYNALTAEEKYAQMTDTINLLYVAFTRSKDNLSVISSLPSTNALKEETNALHTLLYKYVKYATQKNPKDFVLKDGNLFVYRDCDIVPVPNSKQNSLSAEDITIDKITLSDNNVTFSVADKDELDEYFSQSYRELTQMQRGTKYHSFVSALITEDDIDSIILSAERSEENTTGIKNILQYIVNRTKELHWYDGTYHILNERAIVSFDETNELIIRRPDRVMYNDDEVIVVDYKFGKRDEKYKKQVGKYIELIKRMNYFKNKTFKGFIFYINTENLTESIIDNC
ncbi:MAG: UvrD-helicase domain-containing protein [Bacteroidales bacterium]|nr:UvrD-helicase domain-containing protein [Bacteroidales bacterium]